MAALVGVAPSACRLRRTEIVVVLDTDLSYGPGAVLEGAALVVRTGGVVRTQMVFPVGASSQGLTPLPATLGLLPEGDPTGEDVTVEAYGCGAGGCSADDPSRSALVTRTAVVRFATQSTLELSMTLAANCSWVRCDAGQTCDPASRRCVAPNAEDLGVFDPDASLSGTVRTPPAPLASGSDHACTVAPDGTVHCWGDNRRGQLGDGTTDARAAAVPVAGDLGTVAQLALGVDHTCVLRADGEVRCWGYNGDGQLGTGDTQSTSAPTTAVADSGVVDQITAGARHTCGRLRDGTVRCWGDNRFGQLGNGTRVGSVQPVTVLEAGSPLQNVVEVVAGARHTCAWLRDGTVRCWGDNRAGQLGDGGGEESSSTAVSPGLDHVVGLAAGDGHTCARTSGNRIVCWGRNDAGQLGADLLADAAATPQGVAEIPGTIAGLTAGADFTCARTTDDTLWCWGGNGSFQLGDTSGFRRTPAPLATGRIRGATVAAGRAHTCARIARSDAVACWGDGTFGQHGDGRQTFGTATPVRVYGIDDAQQLAVGRTHACAIVGGGAAYCWGNNDWGALGETAGPHANVAVRVAGISNALLLSAGDGYNCATVRPPRGPGETADRPAELRCWGNNSSGQLGDGTLEPRATPVSPGALRGIVSIGTSIGGTGPAHTCVTDSVRRGFCWGDNSWGQFANGTTSSMPTLTPLYVDVRPGIHSPGNLTARVGTGFTCGAIFGVFRSYGLSCAGRSDQGQLGRTPSATMPAELPIPVGVGLDSLTSLALGRAHACAAGASGIQCWGSNSHGQAGVSGGGTVAGPRDVAGLDGMPFAVAAGGAHSCAALAMNDGRTPAVCWGDNRSGELGDGTTQSRATPAEVAGLDGVIAIGAGEGFSCAVVQPGGRVYCWGLGRDGQLGIGPIDGDQDPSRVQGL